MSRPNLRFEEADATSLDYDARFDVVTAARTLQWIADPKAALRRMTRAAKPGGLVIVLDYNHAFNAWTPAPPADFGRFYSRFLSWRESNGWDNEMANHCPALFAEVGLHDIQVMFKTRRRRKATLTSTRRLRSGFEVIEKIGPALEGAGVCDAALLDVARQSYDTWRKTELLRHTLSMRSTVANRRT